MHNATKFAVKFNFLIKAMQDDFAGMTWMALTRGDVAVKADPSDQVSLPTQLTPEQFVLPLFSRPSQTGISPPYGSVRIKKKTCFKWRF